jgi:hypothetical protein
VRSQKVIFLARLQRIIRVLEAGNGRPQRACISPLHPLPVIHKIVTIVEWWNGTWEADRLPLISKTAFILIGLLAVTERNEQYKQKTQCSEWNLFFYINEVL